MSTAVSGHTMRPRTGTVRGTHICYAHQHACDSVTSHVRATLQPPSATGSIWRTPLLVFGRIVTTPHSSVLSTQVEGHSLTPSHLHTLTPHPHTFTPSHLHTRLVPLCVVPYSQLTTLVIAPHKHTCPLFFTASSSSGTFPSMLLLLGLPSHLMHCHNSLLVTHRVLKASAKRLMKFWDT